jgi:hypothetical protein
VGNRSWTAYFYLTEVSAPRSHEQWVKEENGRLYKVTVDCPKAPFSQPLKSMAEQAGMKKKVLPDF